MIFRSSITFNRPGVKIVKVASGFALSLVLSGLLVACGDYKTTYVDFELPDATLLDSGDAGLDSPCQICLAEQVEQGGEDCSDLSGPCMANDVCQTLMVCVRNQAAWHCLKTNC